MEQDDWIRRTLNDLIHQLEDTSTSLAADLSSCGTDALTSLIKAAHSLNRNSFDVALDTLDHMAQTAYTEVSISNGATCWRRLYTDAKLFWALGSLAQSTESDTAEACIGQLDKAIITAGPCGEGRSELLLDIIKRIQTTYLQEPATPYTLYQRTRTHFPPPHSPSTIKQLTQPPSFTSFISTDPRTPFVISGYASHWPATKKWHNSHYLRRVAGPGRVVPVEVGDDYRAIDWTQRIMNWDIFLDSIRKPNTNEVLYLAQHDLFRQFPELRDDIAIPDYVYASLPAPNDFPDYKPPGNDDQLVQNIWLGPAGTISPAHTDPFYNFYVQIVGRKTVWLAPPAVTPHMYPYPPPESAESGHSHNFAANNTEPSMSNTSRVDVFAAPGEDEFQEFWEHAVPQSSWVTLEPGDALFFPPGWWHAMRSEEMSFSVSMWF